MEKKEREQQQNNENKPDNHQATRPFGQRITPQDLEDAEYHKNPVYTEEEKKELYERKVSPSEKRTKDTPEEADPENTANTLYVEASDLDSNGPHYDAKISFDKEEGGQDIFDEENSRYEGQSDNEDGSPPYYEEQGTPDDEQLHVYNETLESYEEKVLSEVERLKEEQTAANDGVAEPYKEAEEDDIQADENVSIDNRDQELTETLESSGENLPYFDEEPPEEKANDDIKDPQLSPVEDDPIDENTLSAYPDQGFGGREKPFDEDQPSYADSEEKRPEEQSPADKDVAEYYKEPIEDDPTDKDTSPSVGDPGYDDTPQPFGETSPFYPDSEEKWLVSQPAANDVVSEAIGDDLANENRSKAVDDPTYDDTPRPFGKEHASYVLEDDLANAADAADDGYTAQMVQKQQAPKDEKAGV
jgi:hypothetical protein